MSRLFYILGSVLFLTCCFSFNSFAGKKKPEKKVVHAPLGEKDLPYIDIGKGVSYYIVRDSAGRKPLFDDFLQLHILMKADTTVNRNTRTENNGQAIDLPVEKVTNHANFMAALPYFSAGDSGIIRVSMDTILALSKGDQLPDFILPGKFFYYEISVLAVRTKGEQQRHKVELEREATIRASQLKLEEDSLLQSYFLKNNLHPQKTIDGIYYIIQKEGSGDLIKKGQNVSINYNNKSLEGKVFDSNTDITLGHAHPISISADMGQVLPGWDKSILCLKKGGKGIFYVPSGLGFGVKGSATVPPNSILMLELEVLENKVK